VDQLGLVEIAGIVIVLCLISWQFVFFQFVRPLIMRRIGRRFSVEVQESVGPWDAGVYNAEESAPLRRTAAVAIADFLVTLLGTVGVFAFVSIPLFLLADSGLPNRWEGRLTGSSVRIGDITVPVMDDRNAVAGVVVRNESNGPMRDCRIEVADYRARDGYLNGFSNTFDLSPGTTQSVELPLSVMKRVPGTHRFRISLECEQRLRDRRPATLQVTD
jgi:hypothetical protein